jgi:hypothetical protein
MRIMSPIEFKFVPECVLKDKSANVPVLCSKKSFKFHNFEVVCKFYFSIFFAMVVHKKTLNLSSIQRVSKCNRCPPIAYSTMKSKED